MNTTLIHMDASDRKAYDAAFDAVARHGSLRKAISQHIADGSECRTRRKQRGESVGKLKKAVSAQ